MGAGRSSVAAVYPGPGKRTYTFETFPTNMRVLERAAEVLEGKRTIADAAGGREGGQSGVMRRAEAMVGASGKLIGVQDIGAADGLWRLAKLYQHSGDFVRSEANCRRLLEIYERLFGVSSPASVDVLNELGLVVASQGRTDEATRVLGPRGGTDAGGGEVGCALDPARVSRLCRHARATLDDAIALGEKAVSLHEPRRGDTYNLGFLWGTLAFAYRDAGKGNDALIAADRSIRIMEKPEHELRKGGGSGSGRTT